MATKERLSPAGTTQRLADVAHSEIRALILNGSLPARSRLPPEVKLAHRFGVSRPVIRQALAMLREEGLIQSRQGSGSFVAATGSVETEPPQSMLFPPIESLTDLESFLSFRQGVEGDAAAAAAQRRTVRQLEDMRAAARAVADEFVPQRLPDGDFAFHLAVARSSNNPFYFNVITSLHDQILLCLTLSWSLSRQRLPSFRSEVIVQHAAVIDAIEAQDGGSAKVAMAAHLRWAHSMLVTGNSLRVSANSRQGLPEFS